MNPDLCSNPACHIEGHGCRSVSTHMQCQGPWRKGRRTGVHGATGEVYEAHKVDAMADSVADESYVIKQISFVPEDDSEPASYHEYMLPRVQNEIMLQIRAADAGLAVPVLELLLDDDAAFIIMPRLEKTAEQVLNKLSHRHQEDEFSTVSETLKQLLSRLHQLGIVHGDPNLNNFMCSTEGRWYIIDFDRSRDTRVSLSDIQYDLALLQSYINKVWQQWQQ